MENNRKTEIINDLTTDKVEPDYPTAGGIGNIEEVRREIKNQRKR